MPIGLGVCLTPLFSVEWHAHIKEGKDTVGTLMNVETASLVSEEEEIVVMLNYVFASLFVQEDSFHSYVGWPEWVCIEFSYIFWEGRTTL